MNYGVVKMHSFYIQNLTYRGDNISEITISKNQKVAKRFTLDTVNRPHAHKVVEQLLEKAEKEFSSLMIHIKNDTENDEFFSHFEGNKMPNVRVVKFKTKYK